MAASIENKSALKMYTLIIIFFTFTCTVITFGEKPSTLLSETLEINEKDTVNDRPITDFDEGKENVAGQVTENSDDSSTTQETDDDEEEENTSSTFQQSLHQLTKIALDNLNSYKEYLFELLQELQNTTASENNSSRPGVETASQEKPVSNATSVNSTEAVNNLTYTKRNEKQRRIVCHARNLTNAVNRTIAVRVVNSTVLQEKLQLKNETAGNCFLVMFYAPWCIFCARTAPAYNALARSFPQMELFAIDAFYFSSLNARFGTIAVPNILLFSNGRPVSRFNGTERSLATLISYVANVTGFNASEVNITEADYIGPLSSVPTEDTNYLLILSWAFVIAFSSIMIAKSNSGMQLWHKVQLLWQEHQHQHVD
ncbi:thioredoxin domain-containing protein 15-like [Tubulanus polymorphus]|uniref:thioredoxin domain-containing protein 15-like n=1 Tax=Tubulanus polymorphus TaxID=672921 RepID=UPI003DA58574